MGLLALLGPACRADDDPACASLVAEATRALEEGEFNRSVARARDAMVLLDRAARLCSNDPEIPFLEGLGRVLLGDLDGLRAARKRVERLAVARALELNRSADDGSNDPRVLYLQALDSRHFGNKPGDAAATLRRLRNHNPGFRPGAVTSLLFASLLEFASQLSQNDDGEGAIREASSALGLAGADPVRFDQASHRLAQVLSATAQWADAQPILEQLAKRQPENPRILFDLASAYAEQLRLDLAIATWEKTIELLARPGVDRRVLDLLVDAPMRLGVCLSQRQGRAEEGKAQLLKYVEAHPNDGRGWYYLGKAAVDALDDPDRAIEWFERARALDTACEKTLRELYKLYSTARRDDAKAKELATMIEKEAGARKAEFARRKRTRLDGSNGCY